MNNAAEGDLCEKLIRTRNGYELEVPWEYPRPIGNEVVLRKRYVRVTASNHLGEVAVHNANATRKIRYLGREDRVGCGLSDQTVHGGAVSSASRLLDSIRQSDPRTDACYIGEAMNSEGVAFANKQGGAAIF